MRLTLVLMAYLHLLVSCVGTIDKAEPDKTKFLDRSGQKIDYIGIDSAKAIAHDKIELYFWPFLGSFDVEYRLYLNESKVPIEIPVDAIETHPDGRLRYVIRGLNSGETYLVRLGARDMKTGAESQDEKISSIQTYINQVTDFSGVTQVQLYPGESSSKILVKWVSAPFVAALGYAPFDPIKYRITIVSETAGLENMNNPNYPEGEDKRIIDAPLTGNVSRNNNPGEEIIGNLKPNTKYFVQVQAIHYQAWENRNNIALYNSILKEGNTKTIAITTDAPTTLYDFNTNSFALQSDLGVNAFSRFILTWQGATGSFKRYAVFFKKVFTEGEAVVDPNGVDLLDNNTIKSLIDSQSNIQTVNGEIVAGRYYVASQFNYFVLENLNRYTTYQVKVALCRSEEGCDIDEGLGVDGIVSSFRVGRTFPSLPPFTGITTILNPESEETSDEITLNFDPPTTSLGFADQLRVYCVDPTDKNNKSKAVLLSTISSGTSSATQRCHNLQLKQAASIIGNNVIVKGVNAFDQLQYCFAITTAITQKDTPVPDRQIEQELAFENAVVRCITPEIILPNNNQFAGFKNNCQVNQNQAMLTWDPPSSGIYQGFKVYYRLSENGEMFSFADAVSGDVTYGQATFDTKSPVLPISINNLEVGRKYLFGVLAYFENSDNELFYSEYNLGIKECDIPLPGATFDGFRRIFAVGPKINGLEPRVLSGGETYSEEAYIWETLDNKGIITEATIGALPPAVPSKEKGRDVQGSLKAASNRGIISLAWKDVQLTNSFYDAQFASGQGIAPERYGYRIFRSDNNRLSWTLLNPDHLIQSEMTSYNRRAGSAVINERVAYFTDYSVENILAQGDLARGRIYYYRIVPIFNSKPVIYNSNTGRQEIKVILPPEGMALVSRKIANRAACLEMNKDSEDPPGGFVPDDEHYRCYYNGVGNSPLGYPWSSDALVYDQGGDMLVDRFEMGCKFTRGSKDKTNYTSNLATFSSAEMSQEKGCTTTWAGAGVAGVGNNYDKLLDGDCLGSSSKAFFSNAGGCAGVGTYSSFNLIFPGADRLSAVDCFTTSMYEDKTSLTGGRRSMVMQSEFAAVFFNQKISSDYRYSLNEPIPSGNLSVNPTEGMTMDCNINLAALDSSSYVRARWLSINRLDKNDLNLLTNSMGSILSNAFLYDQNNLRAPSNPVSSRYNSNTKLARIMTGNEAKLPPLSNIKQNTAAKICSTYGVQLGITSSTGQFFSTSPVAYKRLLRRKEFVAAANHPELLTSTVANPDYPNDDDRETMTEVEAQERIDCTNSSNKKNITLFDKDKNKFMSLLNNEAYVAHHENSLYAVTGSSKSKKCVSRYGIQDLIGNVKEVGPEKMFCDFSKEKFDVVKYSPNGFGDSLTSLPGGVPRRIWKNATFKKITSDGLAPVTDPNVSNMMFGGSLSTQGYCSIVDDKADEFDIENYQGSDGFTLSFDDFGNLNTSIIKKTLSFDQKSVDGLRNGDGTFLHSGKGFLAPSMSSGQSQIKIRWESEAIDVDDPLTTSATSEGHTNWSESKAPYFNPVIGLPLECGLEVSNCNSSPDNKKFTRKSLLPPAGTTLFNDMRSSYTLFQLDQHSKARNRIASDWWNNNCAPPGQVGDGCGGHDVQLITEVIRCDDPNGCPANSLPEFGAASYVVKTISQLEGPGGLTSSVEYESIGWGKDFGSTGIEFVNGNDFRNPAGRFGFELNPRSEYDADKLGIGMRCSVLFED